jgi:hypothetical protein
MRQGRSAPVATTTTVKFLPPPPKKVNQPRKSALAFNTGGGDGSPAQSFEIFRLVHFSRGRQLVQWLIIDFQQPLFPEIGHGKTMGRLLSPPQLTRDRAGGATSHPRPSARIRMRCALDVAVVPATPEAASAN